MERDTDVFQRFWNQPKTDLGVVLERAIDLRTSQNQKINRARHIDLLANEVAQGHFCKAISKSLPEKIHSLDDSRHGYAGERGNKHVANHFKRQIGLRTR